MTYDSSIGGSLVSASDTRTFTLNLNAGQTFTARVSTAGAFPATLTVQNTTGGSMGTFTAPAAAGTAIGQALTASATGTYTFIVSNASGSGSGAFTLGVDLNAVRESESVGGATNDTRATAQALTLVALPGSTTVSRAAVRGAFEGVAVPSAPDFYSVTLTEGEVIAAAGTTAASPGVSLLLTDANGVTLATGAFVNGGLVSAIDAFRVPATGTYYLRLTGPVGVGYTLNVNRGASFDLAPNDTAARAQVLSAVPRALGRIAPSILLSPVSSDGFETGPLSPAKWTTFSSRAQGRIQVSSARGAATGTSALLMDNAADDSVFTLNEAEFGVDLTGRSPVTLSFAHASFDDELDAMPAGAFTGHANGDGIAISADGVNWYTAWASPANATATFATYTIDLTAVAAQAGFTLGEDFRVRLQQYDDRSLTGLDGRGWDDVRVLAPLADVDYYAIDLSAGDAATVTTKTPGDGAGEPLNLLDPRLEIYAPNGSLVTSNDNGAADGRNALATFNAATTGRFLVKVLSAPGTAGDYLVDAAVTPSPVVPQRPDLTADADTGFSLTDNVTRQNNSLATRPLRFFVDRVTPGATVRIFLDGTQVASGVASSSAITLTTNGSTTFADGTHVITARQTPSGGAQSPPSAGLTITIDASVPETPGPLTMQQASDLGVVGDAVTSFKTPSFDLSVPAEPFFRVYRNAAKVSGDYEPGNFYQSDLLANGTYAFGQTAVDLAGNESPASPFLPVTITNAEPPAPATPIDLTSDNGFSTTDNITNTASPTFALPAGLTGFRVFANGVPLSTAPRTGTTFTSPALADGTYEISYTVFNGAIESAPGGKLTIVLDTVAPAAPTAAPDLDPTSDNGASNTDDQTNDNTPTFIIPAGTPYARLVRDGVLVGGAFQTGTTVTTPAVADGTNVWAVRNVDLAGNESGNGPTLTVTIYTVKPPKPPPLDLADESDAGLSGTDNVTSIAFQKFIFPAGLANIRIYRNNVLQATLVNPGTSYTSDAQPAASFVSWNYEVFDFYGNTSDRSNSISPTLTTDLTPPLAAQAPDLQAASDTGASNTDNVTADDTPSFTIAGVLSSEFYRVLRDGVAISALYIGGATSTFTAPAQPNGTFVYTAQSVDRAGNLGPISPGLTVTIDTAGPAAPVAAGVPTAPDAAAAQVTPTPVTPTPAKSKPVLKPVARPIAKPTKPTARSAAPQAPLNSLFAKTRITTTRERLAELLR